MQYRLVPISEIDSCPEKRLDAGHYIPVHRIWECMHGNKLRKRGNVVKAWLDGKITSEELGLAMRYT